MNFVNAELNSQQLSTVIDDQIVTILDELDNYNYPLSEEIMNNKTALSATYAECKGLFHTLKLI